jgi:anti-sigma regulatory factor (Ser/Thr protein kinase)
MSRAESSRLVLHDDLAELKRLAAWIEAWAQQDISSDVSFAIQLCLEEAVANIIMYAGGSDGRLDIIVEVECNAGTLVARVVDNGREFDPTRVPPPSLAASLAEARIGDLGIHLVRSFASGMHYERSDGRNRLTLRFKETAAKSPQSA